MIWFKVYHSIINDEKFLSIKAKHPKIKNDTIGWAFINLLSLASMGEERGSIRISQVPEIAFLCDRNQNTIKKIFQEFLNENIIVEDSGYYRVMN